jgi:hypothetical protein
LDSNKEYIAKILADKSFDDAFRVIRLHMAHEFAVAAFSDTKSDFVNFYDLVNTMAAKNFIGIHESEYLRLQNIKLLFWMYGRSSCWCFCVFRLFNL